jgi:ketol-acid reductoisomerase
VLAGARVAVVGYGNQGRPWALNLRDSGLDISVCVRADATREQAREDGFDTGDLEDAPELPLRPKDDALVIVASGYTLAFDRFDPQCDVGMVAPRMLGPEVRRCYTEGVGFITAFGVHRDATGNARSRLLAVAKGIGGLRQGAIEMTPRQEAILDLTVEQALSPALRHATTSFVTVMLEHDIPLEAIITELILSGEVERTYRLLRTEGYAAQMEHHSPVSQYGQLSREHVYDHLDITASMREIVDGIASGRFADEWDAERASDFAKFKELKEAAVGPEIAAFENDLRTRLGEGAIR